MSAKSKLDPVTRQTFNCASLTGAYQVVSAGGFSNDLAIFKAYNSSSNDIDISYNDTDDQDIIPSGGTFILDIQANKEGERCAWPKGREVFVKGTASAGTLYLTGYTIKRA
tara:strand:- start:303 stop:635 length:333 start_codon:yes stop_codon:yes gene_type:complete